MYSSHSRIGLKTGLLLTVILLAGRPSQALQRCLPQRLFAVARFLVLEVPSGFPIPWEVTVMNDCGELVGDASMIASFSNGDPPIVFLSLGNGTYVGTWRPLGRADLIQVTIRAERPPLERAEVRTTVIIPRHFELSKSDFVFAAVEGSSTLLTEEISIINLQEGEALRWSLRITIPQGGGWLSINQMEGATSNTVFSRSQLTMAVNPTGLAAGTYQGLLTVTAIGANFSRTATVHLLVVPRSSEPLAQVFPTGFIFSAVERALNPPPQTFLVRNSGGGTLSFRLSLSTRDGATWLVASPLGATAPATVNLQINNNNLPPGIYRGTVVLEFSNGQRPELTVLLLVSPALTGVARLRAYTNQASACEPKQLLALSSIVPNHFFSVVGWPLPIVVRLTDNCANAIDGATVVASFSTGESVLLKNRLSGLYTGTWTPVGTGNVRVIITARGEPLQPALQPDSLELVGQRAPFSLGIPVLFSKGVVNAASFARDAPVAPGTIISLFGLNLAGQELEASAPLPRNLGGVKVRIGDLEAPLFYVGPFQVNAQVPYEFPADGVAPVVIEANGRISPVSDLLVSSGFAPPAIFTTNKQGTGQGAILNQDSSPNSAASAAARGSVIQIFATGLGPTNPAVPSGSPAPSSPPAVVTNAVTATIGGVNAPVQFTGLAPGFVGLYQVNVEIPAGVTPGPEVPVILLQNGVPSNTVTLAVR